AIPVLGGRVVGATRGSDRDGCPGARRAKQLWRRRGAVSRRTYGAAWHVYESVALPLSYPGLRKGVYHPGCALAIRGTTPYVEACAIVRHGVVSRSTTGPLRDGGLDLALAISLRPADAALAEREDFAELDGHDVLQAVCDGLATLGSVRV